MAAIGVSGRMIIGTAAANLIKLIPGTGTIMGGGTAAALTLALGKALSASASASRSSWASRI